MSLTTEKKTLSIKGKPGMFQTLTQLEMIEKKLQESAKLTLEHYNANYPILEKDDKFRLYHTTTRSISDMIARAFEDVQNSMKYPAQTRTVFKKIATHVHEFLMKHEIANANLFKKAFDDMAYPKEQPKVYEDISSNKFR